MKKSHIRLLIIVVAVAGICRISSGKNEDIVRENEKIDFRSIQDSIESGYDKVAPFIHDVKEIVERVSGLTAQETVPNEATESITLPVESPVESESNASFTIEFVDVGQGDCIIVTDGENHAMIDTGMYTEYDAVQNALMDLEVYDLDYLILTHPDADHIGNAADIIDDYTVDVVLMPAAENDSKTYRNTLEAIEDSGVIVENPKLGDTYSLGDGTIQIVGPVSEDLGLYSDTNSYSICAKFVYKDTSYLFMGDATGECTDDMIAAGADLSADVIKATHHGSANDGCNSNELYDTVSPQSVVISCGYENSYGHPHWEVLEMCESENLAIYRTDLQGDIISYTDGKHIGWNVAEWKEDI